MSNSDRSDATAAGIWAMPLIGIILAAALAWGIGYLQARDNERRYNIPRSYREDAKSHAQRACVGVAPATIFDCVEKYTSSGYEQARAEQELSAQQRAATSALLATIISFLTLFISIAGVWFVKRTLDATLIAVADTSEATRAMREQNLLAQKVQRPWIAIEVNVGISFVQTNGILRIPFKVMFKNIGHTEANRLAVFVGSSTGSIEDFIKGTLSKSDIESKDDGITILPSESLAYSSSCFVKVAEIEWVENPIYGKCIKVRVSCSAAYTDNEGVECFTGRTFSIGLQDPADPFVGTLIPSDVFDNLRERTLAAHLEGWVKTV